MTREEIIAANEAAKTFADKPSPEAADSLLRTLSKHQHRSQQIRNIIDDVLDYKFLVGSIVNTKEVATD